MVQAVIAKQQTEKKVIDEEASGCRCHQNDTLEPLIEVSSKVTDDFYKKEKAVARHTAKRHTVENSTEEAAKKKGKVSRMVPNLQSISSVSRDSLKWVGAHISAAGGLPNAIHNALRIGGQSLALFLKSQRKWDNPDLSPSMAKAFIEAAEKAVYIDTHRGDDGPPARAGISKRILPHGSYLINLANDDVEKRKKSFDNFMDDLRRCEACHIGLYNFHPGSTVGSCSVERGIQHIAEAINKAHSETSFVTVVLENMVCNITYLIVCHILSFFIYLVSDRPVKDLLLVKLSKNYEKLFIL